jgi:putative oxidoreductase
MCNFFSSIDVGLFMIRIALAIVFIRAGFDNLYSGKEKWIWLGHTMKNVGINFLPLFWGMCSIISEIVGGICILLGFYTNIAAFFLCITMTIATLYHINTGDSWQNIFVPLSYVLILMGLICTGAGNYAIKEGASIAGEASVHPTLWSFVCCDYFISCT